MTIKNWVRTGTACAALAGALSSTAAFAADFSFDDIHYWIGEGTNRAAVVLDWNNGQPGSSLAWGVRWNGASTNAVAWLRRMDWEDRRLGVSFLSVGSSEVVQGAGYDADGDGGAFDFTGGSCTDADDWAASQDGLARWVAVLTNAVHCPSAVEWPAPAGGLDAVFLDHGDWLGLVHQAQGGAVAAPARPTHAQSPFAFQVVDFYTNEEELTFNGMEYANIYPGTVVGRPSSVCPGWEYEGYVFPDVTITPHSQAFGTNQVFAMASSRAGQHGFVTIKFDHKVVDDPLNPYGLDFIVFGNAFLLYGDLEYFDGSDDPANYRDGSGAYDAKPGKVEVSQDGVHWAEYDDGPFANTFAPTISHRYEPEAPDASLFAGNAWWGRLADPTLPVDPSLTPTDFMGRTIAEYATLFNGSSGGVGFDIDGLDLPVDESTGRKWIQYVRVTSLSSYDDAMWTVVDAFSDVAPALPYDNWAREHYAWTQLPDKAVSGKEAIAANGKPNFYNAAFGTAPDATPVAAFKSTGFAIENGRAVFRVPSAEYAFDAFRIGTASVVDGLYRDTLPVLEGTAQTPGGFESVFSVPVDPAAAKAFYKIGISAE